MQKDVKLNVRLAIAVFLVLIGSGLLIAGFIVPPVGIIDSSVLVAFGEVSTFCGALCGLDTNYKYKELQMTQKINKEK